MKYPVAAALIAVVLVIIVGAALWMMVPGPAPGPDEDEAHASAVEDETEVEDEEGDLYGGATIAMRDEMAKQSLEANCLVCHEMRMITSQRLTPAQWKAEVDKMINWGAVASEGEQALIVDHLARTYPAEAERAPAEFIAMAAIESPEIVDPDEEPIEGDPAQGERLYKTLCAACHGPTAIGGDLGPSLANRAIIGHAAAYNEIVREGLRTRMPPFKTVLNDQQQRDILVWLRGLPHDAVAQAAQ